MHRLAVAALAFTWLSSALAGQEGIAWMSINGASTILSEAANGKAPEEGFFGSVSLGYLANTGNTDSASLNAKTSLGYVSLPWRHALMLRALTGSTNDQTTAREYEVAAQTDYIFGDRHYIFGAVNYNTNRFAGYDNRFSEVVGYGRRVIATPRHTLDLQLGLGGRQTEFVDGTREDEGIVQFTGAYTWEFSKHANFSQRLRIEDGSTNTFTESTTALTANLTGDLALSLSFTARRNSNVPAGAVSTDTATLVSIIYGF